MSHPGTWLLTLGLLMLGMTGVGTDPAFEPVASRQLPGTPRFTALTYAASGAFGRLQAQLEFRPATSQDPDGAWVADVRMHSKPRLYWDKRTLMRSWFRPDDGEVLRATRLSLGRKPDRKIYRFQPDGAHRVRIEPGRPEEEKLPPDRWTHVKESFHAYSPDALGCSVVSDAAALFFLASSRDVTHAPGDVQHCFFSGKTLYLLDIEPQGRAAFEVDYLEIPAAGEPIRHTGPVQTLRWHMKARPVAGKLDEDDADLEVLLDAGTGVPLRIGSRMPGLGFLDVDLVSLATP